MKKYITFLCIIYSFNNIYGQWINNPMVNNTVVNTQENDINPVSVSDGAGGSIIFFTSGNDYDLYAQKITTSGVLAWGGSISPVLICNAPFDQYDHTAIADGSGGAYLAWSDYRDGLQYGKIYMQHINAAGTVLWLINGLQVANTVRDDSGPALCSDGAGGVIIGWTGDDLSTNVQAYAQRFISTGVPQWGANGLQICTAPAFRGGAVISTDGSNGAMFFFTDSRNDHNGLNYDSLVTKGLTNGDIYAQRLNGNGDRLWTSNGVALCAAPGNQDAFENSIAVTDGAGGAIMVFIDGRNDVMSNYINLDIFAQRINSSGVVQWSPNGVPVCTSPGNQYGVSNCVVPDGVGGVVTTWGDEDSSRVFMQRLNGAGAPLWTVNGVRISTNMGSAFDPVLVNDGAGNFVVAYKVSYPTFSGAILAKKLNAAGSFLWDTAGTIISVVQEGFGNAGSPNTVLSDSGNIIACWNDRHGNFSTQDIFASKILTNGTLADGTATYITIANGNWNNSSIWQGGQVPSPGIAAIVRHQVMVIANAICWSLKVEQPSGSVTVKTGVNLLVEH